MIDEKRELLGTEVNVILVAEGEEATAAVLRAFSECARIEREYSRFLDDNQLFALNASVGDWVKVSEELYGLLSLGKRLNEFSAGAFDLTVKSVLDSWGYDKNYSLEENGVGVLGTVELGDDFMVKISAEVDLGGVGKGYALDRMVECLKGFENFCVNAGGDIFAKGHNFNGDLWKILFENPLDNSSAIGFVEVDGMALASSSPSKRKWRDKHHIVDPLKKLPANEMMAVYVQAEQGVLADAYATTLFAMGYEKAVGVLNDLPVEAMLIGAEGAISKSSGFMGELFFE